METGLIPSSKSPADLQCQEARILLQQMAGDDPNVTPQEADALALHVALCPECERAFYRSVGMNEDGSFTATHEACLLQQLSPIMTVEEGWQDLLRRCPDLAKAYYSDLRWQGVRRMLRRAGQVTAMAASLAVLLIGGWLLVQRSHSSSPVASQADAKLVILKDSIQLRSPSVPDAVNVMAGYASTAMGHTGPAIPVVAATLAATAWACDVSLANAVARVAPQMDEGLLAAVRDGWRQSDLSDLDRPETAHELLKAPPTSQCASQAAAQRRRLTWSVTRLLPQADPSPEVKRDH